MLRHLLASIALAPLAAGQCTTLYSWDFSGTPPAGTTMQVSGLWHTTTACIPGGTTPSGGEFAYYGDDSVCNFESGWVGGYLTLGPIAIPTGQTTLLSYHSAYAAETCDTSGCCDFDHAYLYVVDLTNSVTTRVDFPCDSVPGWLFEERIVDLTPFRGSTIQLRWHFYAEDGISNHWYGFAVDDVLVRTSCTVSAPTCSSAPNSTGLVGEIQLWGSAVVTDNDMLLVARDLPSYWWGYFLMSRNTAFVPGFAGSQGTLCVGAPIVRFNNPAYGGVLDMINGLAALRLDPNDLPQGNTFLPGDVWHFQFWHRDWSGTPTSNTTASCSVTFQ